MGGILGGGSNAKQPKAVGSLQFQTSQQGGVIPLVYGTTRMTGNLLDYDDFTATPSSKTGGKGKGGGGGKGGGQQYTYSASFIMGMCQGPIAGMGTVWWDKNITTLSALTNLSTINLGDDSQATDPFWATNHPSKALSYSGTANFTCNNYQLGYTATLPNFSVEIEGIETMSGANGYDANPAAVVADFLTNARYGAGFPHTNLDPAITSLAATSYQSYCSAAGIFVSPMLDTQQTAQQCLAEIANLSNSAIVWSGGLLKIIPYGDQALTASYQLVMLGGTVAEGGADTISIDFSHPDLPGSPITVNYTTTGREQTYAAVGSGMVQAILGTADLTAFGVWGGTTPSGLMIALLNATAQATSFAASSSGGITIALGSTAGPFTYTPDTTPIYSIDDGDYIVQESSVGGNSRVNPGGPALRSGAAPITGGFTDDPLHIVRSTPADANNYVQLQCRDRGNSYNSHIIETFDQAAVDLHGIRRDTSLKAEMIVDPYLTGAVVAQLVLQRALLFRNTYSFKLGWKYCLLEPMDLVQISDARLGVAALTVRITAVEEDNEGTLTITAEDFFGGYLSAVLYAKQSAGGYVPNWNATPGDANPPLIFEPPAALLSRDLEIWVALSGGNNWGGAQVWISSDGSSYAFAGTIPGPATQGTLSAALPDYSGSEPDTTNTLAVDLTQSQGQLLSVSAADAANFATLCYVGGELLAYQTATLTTIHHYALTELYRGAYGSAIGSHASGAQFARLDQAIGRFPYPSNLVGQTIHLKFPSANLVGGGAQSLASVPAYTYTITGSGRASVATTVSGSQAGSATANLVAQRYVFADTVIFPAGLTGSQGTAGAAATATATYSVRKNGAPVGTMVFPAGAAAATFTMSSATTYVAGDILTVVAPASPDPTLANLAWTLVGSR
jgi:Putative phage tail protein